MGFWDETIVGRWGTSPKVALEAAVGANSLRLTGVGAGRIAQREAFWIGDQRYEVTSDATISGNTITLLISPVVLVLVPDQTAVTDINALAIDAHLTEQESRMPGMAKRAVSDDGKTAYDGKRKLAKRDIATWLKRHGYHVEGVLCPDQLNRSAVFLELAMIYRDLAVRNDTISAQKADYYLQRFQEEIDGISLEYDGSLEEQSVNEQTITTMLWRG